MQSRFTRRSALGVMGAAATLPLIGRPFQALAADPSTVTIAYNVNLPSFDPTVGASAVNPTIQALYQSIFDPYIAQNPDLTFKPGLLTKWGWSDDKKQIQMEVREGATWHNGDPVTAEDVVWSLERAGKPKDRQSDPVHLVEDRQLQDRRQQDHRRRARSSSRPSSSGWASSPATSCPRNTTRASAPEGFEKKPIGSGPYMVDEFQQNAFLRLKANAKYWGGKPAFDTVIFKFVPDATSRVAEVEVRLVRRHARNSLRGVRPAEGQARSSPATRRRSPTSR